MVEARRVSLREDGGVTLEEAKAELDEIRRRRRLAEREVERLMHDESLALSRLQVARAFVWTEKHRDRGAIE